MEGKRNQGVVHKYLLEAAEDILIKGVPLAQRLYVPEAFSESTKTEARLAARATKPSSEARSGSTLGG